jgi:hypothetical protein
MLGTDTPKNSCLQQLKEIVLRVGGQRFHPIKKKNADLSRIDTPPPQGLITGIPPIAQATPLQPQLNPGAFRASDRNKRGHPAP